MTREEKRMLIKKIKTLSESIGVFFARRPLAKKILIDDDENCLIRRTLLARYRSEEDFQRFVEDYNSLHQCAKELIEKQVSFF